MRAKINLDQVNTNKPYSLAIINLDQFMLVAHQSSNLAVRFRGREGLGEGEFIYFY